MLVVVAIIGILASLMFPALSGARQAAFAGKCRGNLRELGQAFSLYATDNNDWLPKRYDKVATEEPQDWMWYLKGYGVYSSAVLRCQANTYAATGRLGGVTSYAIHTGLRDLGGPIRRVLYTPLTKTGLLVDGTANWIKDTQPTRVAKVHPKESANILYLDWHVASYQPDGNLEEFFYFYMNPPSP